MITITQVSQLLAAGATIEQLTTAGASMDMIKAALGAPPPAPAPASSGLAAIRAALDPTDYGSGFMDPVLRMMSDERTYDGRAGCFDGSYVARLRGTEYKNTKKGALGSLTLEIVESRNPRVAVGETKEHSVWCNTPAGASDLKGVVQKLAEAVGPSALREDGRFTDDFFLDFETGGALTAGSDWRVDVHSHPQKQNAKKSFTDVRLTPIGEAAAAPSAPSVVPVDINALLASMGQPAPAPATPGIPPELQAMLAALGK